MKLFFVSLLLMSLALLPQAKAQTIAGNRASTDVNVLDFGADPTDTIDSAPAINAAIAYIKTLPTPISYAQGSSYAARLVFAKGTYKILSGLNFTGLHALNFVIDMEGAIIDCQVTGGVCVDALASQFLRFNGLAIVGSNVNTPKIGFQNGRRTGADDASTFYFDRPSITGYFTLAAFYTYASEIQTIVSPAFYNQQNSATAYTMILDGVNHWGVTSAFQTVTAPLDTAQSFTAVNFIGGSIMEVATGNSASAGTIWISNLEFSSFVKTYVENSGNNANLITIWTTPVFAIVHVDFLIHAETTTLANIFYLDGPASTVNGQLRRFRYEDEYPEASNAIFKVSANIGFVDLYDMDIHIDAFLYPAAKVFDNPALWTVTGNYWQNVGTSQWNAPASFSGSVNPNLLAITSPNGSVVQLAVPGGKQVWIGSDASGLVNLLSPVAINGGLTLGNGGFSSILKSATAGTPVILQSALALTKQTADGTAPGAALGKLELVCGTNSGSAKIIAYAGTSTTPVTIVDNIGTGVTGC